MNRFSLFLTSVGSLLFAACGEDLNFETGGTEDKEIINITTSITPLTSDTRAVIEENGLGEFSADDRILLFISSDGAAAQAHTMTMGANGWQPQLYWNDIKGQSNTFSAFYPEAGSAEAETFTHSVAVNQSADADYLKSDILHAKTIVAQKESVNLSFNHLMSRICISLTSDGSYSAEELAAATMTIEALNGVEVQKMNGTLGQVSGSAVKVVPHKSKSGKLYALLCPQTVADSWKSTSWIEITIGGETLSYKAPAKFESGATFDKLESGKQINLTIKLKKKPVVPNPEPEKPDQIDWRGKTGWVYGLNVPSVDTWGYIAAYPSMEKGLKWTPDGHWFDCNKISPNEHKIDSEMCWAGATSNLLYWWMDQNKDYITRYGKYNGPSKYSSLDSDIFKFFREKFGNTGVDVAAALDWFLTGQYGMHEMAGAGFFKEVLGLGHVARITRFGERSLSDELKYAFSHKEAIECTHSYSGNLIHAITIWGADFDQNGEVIAIYVTENNDRDLDEQNAFVDWKGRQVTPAGIIRKRLQKKSDGSYYMESSVADNYTLRIMELNLISLMEDKWEAYFQRQ